MYYLYHIPGKKIGVTRNINNRVTVAQGYKPGEYEVLDQSEDINYISNREIELQNVYGYKVDRTLYKNLFKSNMRINPTEQTSTFPVPLNKLKGNLMDNLGVAWETPDYKFKLEKEHIPWIMQNARTSMFNEDRSYIYNKAFYEAFFNSKHNPDVIPDRFELIRQWARKKGILDNGDTKTQYIKLLEETGELAQAILKNDRAEFIDAIGDCVVVLTNLAELGNVNIEHCIDESYAQISNRTGRMVNGTFVKTESL